VIDSHAHLDMIERPTTEVVADAEAAGVRRVLTIGIDGNSCRAALQLAQDFPQVRVAVGRHPNAATGFDDADGAELAALAAHDDCVAIGETGLDYYYDHSPRALQRECFERFIDLARRVNKPVVCHIRDANESPTGAGAAAGAHEEARAILKAGGAAELGCVIHCFTGSPADARAYAELGCYVSFSGIVTYKTAQGLRDSVPLIPLDRLLIETDCPYLAPIPKRGKRNEPSFIVHTAEQVARSAGISFEELARITAENAARVFKIGAA
jgi:TatD DNase family protein